MELTHKVTDTQMEEVLKVAMEGIKDHQVWLIIFQKITHDDFSIHYLTWTFISSTQEHLSK